ncbi:MAG TPA: hypothetical protein VFU76_13695 [Terriglobales bacterium]|nr:hypothetical protein [Terriglobales bacterium]
MFGSAVLEIAIGLALVYLVLALICSTVTESLAGMFSLRSRTLQKAVLGLLAEGGGDSKMAAKFFAHPLIKKISKGGTLPSYISPQLFSRVLVDILSPGSMGRALTEAEIGAAIDALPPSELRDSLRAVVNGKNLANAEERLAAWFDSSMNRVSGWYKRKAQAIAFAAAIVIVVFANADTVQLTNTLWSEPELRAQVVQQAQQASQAATPEQANLLVEYQDGDSPAPSAPISIKNIPEPAGPVSELLGWRSAQDAGFLSGGQYGSLIRFHVVGWLLTAFAVSLGAPFWFDTLKRIINIRNAGVKPASLEAVLAPAPAKAQAAAAGGQS